MTPKLGCQSAKNLVYLGVVQGRIDKEQHSQDWRGRLERTYPRGKWRVFWLGCQVGVARTREAGRKTLRYLKGSSPGPGACSPWYRKECLAGRPKHSCGSP